MWWDEGGVNGAHRGQNKDDKYKLQRKDYKERETIDYAIN